MTGEATARSFEFRAGEGLVITAADWEARAAQIRASLSEDGLEPSMAEALGSFRFVDDGGRTWTYDGAAWQAWDGTRWAAAAPPASLRLQPFTLDALPDVADSAPAGAAPLDDSEGPFPTPEEIAEAATQPATAQDVAAATGDPAAAAAPTAITAAPPTPTSVPPPSPTYVPPSAATGPPAPGVAVPQAAPAPAVASSSPAVAPAYRPTHIVPARGLPTWPRPDAALAPEQRLDPGLDVMVVESYPNGWARIVCSNAWSAWVDGRLLVASGAGVAPGPAPAAMPTAGTSAATTRAARPALDLRAEIGLAALLGLAAWLLAVFVAPVGLRFAMLGNPIVVGLLIAVAVVAGKSLVARHALTVRDAVMFVVDAIAATVVLYLFSPA
jgi:hypothetical protein